MPEVRSGLAGYLKLGRHGNDADAPGILVRELRGREMIKLTPWPQTRQACESRLGQVLDAALPARLGFAHSYGGITAFRLDNRSIHLVGPLGAGLLQRLSGVITADLGAITALGHAYTILRLTGPYRRDVLARLVPVDVDQRVFPRRSCAVTEIMGIEVIVHFSGNGELGDEFDLYLPRSAALDLTVAIERAAAPFGYEIAV